MKKQRAIETLGGGTALGLSKALGCVKSNISEMPDELGLPHSDRVRGAMIRLGMRIPTDMREKGRVD